MNDGEESTRIDNTRRAGGPSQPVLSLALVLLAVPTGPEIVDRPIPFDAERARLTVAYRRLHEDPQASDVRIVPRMIVVHHTAIGSLDGSFGAFTSARLPAARRELAKGGEVNVSAHFLVDRDGTVFRLMPETTLARHAIGFNHVAIGIENVGGTERAPLTAAQVEANAALVRQLVARFPTIQVLVGHHEIGRMQSHPLRRERVAGYKTTKIDPGPRFMGELRARLEDVALEGPAPGPSANP